MQIYEDERVSDKMMTKFYLLLHFGDGNFKNYNIWLYIVLTFQKGG